MLINHLIKIYFHVCDKYKAQICWQVQRFSNNSQPRGMITDEEQITVYLFCVGYEEKHTIKSMYTHIKSHWLCWFPLLPSYKTFHARLNKLCEAFPILLIVFFNNATISPDSLKVWLGDSFPVVTCAHKRGGKVAQELTGKGYCATKKLHFYGVKVHTLALRRPSAIAFPQYMEVTPASVHDLTASGNILENIPADVPIVDKAYADTDRCEKMQTNNNVLLTPGKEKKGWEAVLKQRDQPFTDLFNKAVSTIRQPVESLFNRINGLTQIQNASKVRSANGLKLHLYGKLTVAMMILANF